MVTLLVFLNINTHHAEIHLSSSTLSPTGVTQLNNAALTSYCNTAVNRLKTDFHLLAK